MTHASSQTFFSQRTRKKITLVFRGSVSKKDYQVDVTVFLKEVPNPVEHQAKRIKVHTGFKGKDIVSCYRQ